jgi:exosome complex RNA-binding protein Csl4
LNKLVLVTAFVVSQVFAVSAFAQTTRAEVKAETKEAVKSGDIAKGQVADAPKAKSTAARADVKKEAAAAEKAGTIATGQETIAPKAKSVKARAEVKADTKDAVKSGDIAKGQVPAGSASAAKK